jgi:hypothetical protein
MMRPIVWCLTLLTASGCASNNGAAHWSVWEYKGLDHGKGFYWHGLDEMSFVNDEIEIAPSTNSIDVRLLVTNCSGTRGFLQHWPDSYSGERLWWRFKTTHRNGETSVTKWWSTRSIAGNSGEVYVLLDSCSTPYVTTDSSFENSIYISARIPLPSRRNPDDVHYILEMKLALPYYAIGAASPIMVTISKSMRVEFGNGKED